MSLKSELQDQIRSLSNSIRSLDIEIADIQSRIGYMGKGHSASTIQGWKNDLQNRKNRRETYKGEKKNYEQRLNRL